jgi:peptidyl-prolyl cis-trans isomerase D
VVSRAVPRELPRKVLEGILSADAAKLPVYLGVESGDGSYIVARIDKVLPRDPAVVDAKRAAQQYAQAWTGAETQAYYNALKTRFKAVVKAPQAAASSAAP